MAKKRSLISELQRRRVFLVLAGYGVVWWFVFQVAGALAFNAALPGWTMLVLVFLAIVGVPITIYLAWIYDVTPSGVIRTPDGPEPSPEHRSIMDRRIEFVLVGILLIAMGVSIQEVVQQDRPIAEFIEALTTDSEN